MQLWVLVIWIHAGVLSESDSMAMEKVEGFSSRGACEVAEAQVKRLASMTVKEVKTVCVEVK